METSLIHCFESAYPDTCCLSDCSANPIPCCGKDCKSLRIMFYQHFMCHLHLHNRKLKLKSNQWKHRTGVPWFQDFGISNHQKARFDNQMTRYPDFEAFVGMFRYPEPQLPETKIRTHALISEHIFLMVGF